jgi:hypothetical protein
MPSLRDFHNMPETVRTLMFQDYGEEIYRTKFWKAPLARDLGVSSATVQKWIRTQSVPVMVMLLLWAWHPRNNKEVRAAECLERVTQTLGQLCSQTQELATIMRGEPAIALTAPVEHDGETA